MMKAIEQNLQKELAIKLKTADEVWVAVALLTKKGLEFIQNNMVKANAVQHYLLGIDLPTEPDALAVLQEQQYLGNLSVAMFVKQEFFHPKVYIIKSKGIYTAFIGSANCTHGALFSNIELSYIVTNQEDCLELISWFKQLEKKSVELNPSFIALYRKAYQKRKLSRNAEEAETDAVKAELEEEFEVTMDARKELIRALKKYHKRKNFEELKSERISDVASLKESLDYPDFKKIDVDAFYNNWALGHLRYTPVEYIKSNLPKFRKLLKLLTDENIDIAIRFNSAYQGDFRITGFSVASISKILTMHNPTLYSVKNEKIDGLLENYGIHLPIKVTMGERYKASSKYMLEICKDAGFEDLAILDRFLYEETTK